MILAKPIKSRAPDVSVSDHAHQRWLERAAGRAPKKRTALAGMLERRLYNHLAGGIQARGLEVYIDMGGGLVAVLCLAEKVWVCTTIRPDEKGAG